MVTDIICYIKWLTGSFNIFSPGYIATILFSLHIDPGVCSQGAVRLQGVNTTTGRVEVCDNNVWGRAASGNFWDTANARVVCRQLGLPSSCEFKKCCSGAL